MASPAKHMTLADAGVIGIALIATAMKSATDATFDLAADIAHTIQPEGCTCQNASICRWCFTYRQYSLEP